MPSFRDLHGPISTDGPDYDNLDEGEPVFYHGERLTEARAAELATEAQGSFRVARETNLIPGRKSLSGDGTHSPRVQFRVPRELEAEVVALAEAEGVSVSALARKALEQFLEDSRRAS